VNRREAGYKGGIAVRDGFAAEFEKRTGRSFYSSISKGRPRLPRYSAKEKPVTRPPGRVARGMHIRETEAPITYEGFET